MKGTLLNSLVAIGLLAVHVPVDAAKRGWFPRRAGECGWVYGRYAVYNGSGLRRIWIIGTSHMVNQRDDDDSPFPPELNLSSGHYPGLGGTPMSMVFGDFYICATEPFKRGHMQHVTIKKARNLSLAAKD